MPVRAEQRRPPSRRSHPVSRLDLEEFLRGQGHTVDARTDINGHMRAEWAGSTEGDNAYDSYTITILGAVGQDLQPLARDTWVELYESERWSPQEIEPDNDPPDATPSDRTRTSTPHNRAVIYVDDTTFAYRA